jgi:membrane-bound lytic murein transglycosylase F
MKINSWLQEYKSSRQLRRTYLAYFDNQRIVSFLKSDYFSENGNRLSPFDDVIRNQARLIFWDWRLLASVIYEESNFRQGQVSSQNASGLMQLMPDIAARYGVDSGSGIAHQIAAGVRYFKYLDSQLPSEIEDPRERIYFLLASYNVGLGRVLSAREKADQYGVNINKWNGHVDYYLLRRSKRDTIAVRDTIDSYPVDYKLEGYVDNIITRFYHYRNLIE